MLVLTRKRAEKIQIGDDIVIKVIKTGKTSVKIGIEAPAHVRVLRSEVVDTPEAAALQAPARPNVPEIVLDDASTTSQFLKAVTDQIPHPIQAG